MRAPPPINKKTLSQYGFIALPVAFAGFPLYVLAPDFYATRHGLSLKVLGFLLLAIRLLDALQDPLFGMISDRLQGRFQAFVIGAGTILCVCVFGLFNGMFFSPMLWFSLCMIFAVSAYSALVIILGTQATLWTKDQNAQTRIAAAREGFGLVGLLIAVSLPTLLAYLTAPDNIYVWYGVVLFLLMALGINGFSKICPSGGARDIHLPPPKKSPLDGLRALPTQSIRLFIVYGVSMLASSIPAVLIIFYVRDLLGAEKLTGLFLVLYFLSGVVGMPVWKKTSILLGKYKAWALSHLLATAGLSWAFFLGVGDIWPYALVCTLSGFAFGADLTLPPSILADDIHAHGNTDLSGTHYAFLAFLIKASLAIASVGVLPLLDVAGFKPQLPNTQSALLTLSTAYALIPCFLKIIAAILLYVFFIQTQTGGKNDPIKKSKNHGSS